VDLLLDDLGFDLGGKAGILHLARTALGREFQPSLELERQLGAKFRPLRRELEALLAGTALDPRAELGLAILAARSRALRGCMATLRAAEASGTLQRPCAELATSFTHLHLNRLLRSSQRLQEFVIYDFLARLHDSRMATRKLAR
jgi:thiopeptide-type bacteriocin biosynthesis protein